MADAKKCDRCKKYYDGNGIPTNDGLIWGGGYLTGLILTTDSDTGDGFDLCDDCINDLLHFLKHPSEKKKEK